MLMLTQTIRGTLGPDLPVATPRWANLDEALYALARPRTQREGGRHLVHIVGRPAHSYCFEAYCGETHIEIQCTS